MNPNVPAGAAILLAFIYKAETGRTGLDAYRTIIGRRESGLTKPVTDFTLSELLEAQKAWGKKWKSSAAGAPQIIRDTLMGLCAKLDLKAEQKFDPDLQDALAFELLKQRGWARFVTGELPLKAFALALAKEWASMPVVEATQGAHGRLKRGQSYYDGDGLNGATVTPGDLEATLAEVLNEATRSPAIPAPPDAPLPPPAPDPTDAIAPPPDRKGCVSPFVVIAALLVAIGLAAIAFFVPLPI